MNKVFLVCYYNLKVSVLIPPKFTCRNLSSSVKIFAGRGAFKRWLDHEGEALMNGVSTFLKDTLENSLFSQVRIQQDDAICEPGSEASLETDSASTLILGFLTSLWETNFSYLLSHSAYGSLFSEPKWTKDTCFTYAVKFLLWNF